MRKNCWRWWKVKKRSPLYQKMKMCRQNCRASMILYVSLVADHRQNYSLKADFQQRIAPPKTVTHILGFFQSEIQSQLPLSINLSSIEQQLHSQSVGDFQRWKICVVRHTNFVFQKFNCDSLINDRLLFIQDLTELKQSLPEPVLKV